MWIPKISLGAVITAPNEFSSEHGREGDSCRRQPCGDCHLTQSGFLQLSKERVAILPEQGAKKLFNLARYIRDLENNARPQVHL